MAQLRAALVQLSVSDDPEANLHGTLDLVEQAATAGAGLVLTPECTNLISADRDWQQRVLHPEATDPTLAALRERAAGRGIWLLVGSLALKPDDLGSDRFVNRSLLIAPDGGIAARYDKIHMFDVTISERERYRESSAYRPGDRAVLAPDPLPIGLSICYDLRFPHLYRALAQAGAQVLTVPSAFNDTTGAAHWHALLRARAIENGAFVLAPAQAGLHAVKAGRQTRPRRSYGHSLAVDPWGEVIAEADGDGAGVTIVDLDLSAIDKARSRIPSLTHDRTFVAP